MAGDERIRVGGVLRFVHRERALIGLSYPRLALVGVLSVFAGFGQAVLLLIVVRGATALTADTEVISGAVGPFSASNLTTSDLIALGFAVLGLLFVIELLISYNQATLVVNATRSTQRRMLEAFTDADFAAQTVHSRGAARQFVLGHPSSAGKAAAQLGSGLSSVTNFVVLVCSATVLSPLSAALMLVGLLVVVVLLRPLLRGSQRLSGRRAGRQILLSGASAERFELVRELKVLGADRFADEPILEGVDEVAGLDRTVRILARMSSVTYRLGALALALLMLTFIDVSDSTNLAALGGALLILLRSLSYGQAAQSSYQSLGEAVPVLRQLLTERARLTAAAEPRSTTNAPAGFSVGRVELKDVAFSYDDTYVLEDCSLAIESGEFVAITGPSGAGKSTLLHVLLRLREPTLGCLIVDGNPAADIPIAWWRDRVAHVAQEPKLRSGTVTESIRFGRAHLSDEDVRAAAAQAHIAGEIEGWPEGYDTDVGQLGESVSGGQRQRLALARALAGKPDLLLLDEPTSALDVRSEDLVAQTLEELRGSMTIVVIAHRPRTVKRADRVIKMEDGKIFPGPGPALLETPV